MASLHARSREWPVHLQPAYAEKVNWTDGIDPKTGKPVEYDANKDLQTYKIGKASTARARSDRGLPEYPGRGELLPDVIQRSDYHLSYGAGLEGCSNVMVDATADARREAMTARRATSGSVAPLQMPRKSRAA